MLDELSNNQTPTTAVKENLVEGVLQNYLDQLLVIATEPETAEQSIEVVEVAVVSPSPSIEKIIAPTAVKIETKKATATLLETNLLATSLLDTNLLDTNLQIATEKKEQLEQKLEEKLEQSVKHLTDQDSWSNQGVECLIFNVCGLSLAVPLLFLGGVYEVEKDDIKPLIGQPKWYLGMLHTDEGNLQVIDTANFIMPERQCNLANDGFKYLIRLEKTPWAIACQSIDDTVRLEASEIKWRGERGKRTWLAGTVIEKMCALVDVSGLLQRVEMNSKPS